jgi:hypothetical protein
VCAAVVAPREMPARKRLRGARSCYRVRPHKPERGAMMKNSAAGVAFLISGPRG